MIFIIIRIIISRNINHFKKESHTLHHKTKILQRRIAVSVKNW